MQGDQGAARPRTSAFRVDSARGPTCAGVAAPTKGGTTSNGRSLSTGIRHALIAALICACGGCHTLKNQIKALAGRDTTGAGAPGSTSNIPHATGGYIKGPPAVLDQTYRVHSAELKPTHTLRVPQFNWEHGGTRSGGAFSDGSGTRHERGY